MKPESLFVFSLVVAALLVVSVGTVLAQEAPPVVHAVLFYSPTCGHCKYVIEEVLPPLYDRYGTQLQILGFDVTTPQGQEMFLSALERYGLEQPGVPLLVIDDLTLVGSQQIPEEFPSLIDAYLARGGAAWPDIPGLQESLIAAAEAATAVPSSTDQPAGPAPVEVPPSPTTWRDHFAADAVANTIAVIVLAGMLAAVIGAVILFKRGPDTTFLRGRLAWIIPALCLLGLIVAGYLAFVETTGQQAVCGPIGDCNTVQQSPYARLFGVLSIGMLGLLGYVSMGSAWAAAGLDSSRTGRIAALALFGLGLLGTLFSIYLTFLEPFVIGATCAWCLTSAVITTAIMLLSAAPAGNAWIAMNVGNRPATPRAA